MAIAYDKKTPHRFDVVGSFLRPARLKEAREQFEALSRRPRTSASSI